jgi:anti-anti-sigma regulatory factor
MAALPYRRPERMNAADPATVSVSSDGDAAVVRLSGTWSLRDGLRPVEDVTHALEASPPPRRLRLDAAGVARWDTSLVVFLARVHDSCSERDVGLDTSGLPKEARRLLELARGDWRAAKRSASIAAEAEGSARTGLTSAGGRSTRFPLGKFDFFSSTSLPRCSAAHAGSTRSHLLQQAGVDAAGRSGPGVRDRRVP